MSKVLDYDDELEKGYDDMLDSVYGNFMDNYPASTVLKEVDPTAYRCGKDDYISSLIDDGVIHDSGDEYHEGREADCDICNPEEEDDE